MQHVANIYILGARVSDLLCMDGGHIAASTVLIIITVAPMHTVYMYMYIICKYIRTYMGFNNVQDYACQVCYHMTHLRTADTPPAILDPRPY